MCIRDRLNLFNRLDVGFLRNSTRFDQVTAGEIPWNDTGYRSISSGSVGFSDSRWSTRPARHLTQRTSSAEGRKSDRDQGSAVDQLERDGQMGADHLADVCHEKSSL